MKAGVEQHGVTWRGIVKARPEGQENRVPSRKEQGERLTASLRGDFTQRPHFRIKVLIGLGSPTVSRISYSLRALGEE